MLYQIFLIGSLLFAFLLLFVVSSSLLGFMLTRVPFVPTRAADIEFIVKKLGITSKDIFYDLGSGNGKVCFIVNKLTGAKCVGFELTWWTYLWAKIKLKFKDQKSKLQFKNQNFFNHNWGEATIIYGYLYPMLMRQVQEKFIADCKPGSRAIIRDFPFPDLKPVEVFYLPQNHEIYVYKV
ncbi:MAG: Histone methylation protein DOT1 [Candidatus Hinthialibacteria bacterium OLB16]|nr:MAG: Histone methylation protein DOT1 [Candidatus Hinthialibacteria bacterium OLB16]